jgi:hypothetical protein
MNRDSARTAAEAFVAGIGRTMGRDLALLDDQTIEFASGWVFFYDSRRYIEGGAIRDALAGNAPLIVSRCDGSVHVTGTAHPVEVYIRDFEATEPP